ncbi:MAG: sigma-54-dependent transcriptional regulator, partial [Gammaproteobacteria bacterium]
MTPRRVLLVEDEAVFARAVEKRLAKAGLACQVAGTLADARRLLMGSEPDAILLDMRLPDGSGLDLLSEIRERRGSAVPVLVLTAYGEVEDAVLAMKLCASDYLKKPIDLEELLVSIDKLFAHNELERALEHSRQRERQGLEGLRFLGEHPSIVDLRGQAERLGSLCAGAAGPPPSVLILGETGTGKDLMAKLLHHSGPRRDRPFVHVDCAALPKDLIEGELFGHEKGAYTSAVGARSGLIEAAEDGVVFLDEVAEIPIELQAKLLAVLERRTVRRLGSTRERPVSAWIIAATNRDPEAMVARGALRADLYFRLNVLAIRM